MGEGVAKGSGEGYGCGVEVVVGVGKRCCALVGCAEPQQPP